MTTNITQTPDLYPKAKELPTTFEECEYTMKVDKRLKKFLASHTAIRELCKCFDAKFIRLSAVSLQQSISFLLQYKVRNIWTEDVIFTPFRDMCLILALNPNGYHLLWLHENLDQIWAIFHLTSAMCVLKQSNVSESNRNVKVSVNRETLPRCIYYLHSFLRWVSEPNRAYGISNWLVSSFVESSPEIKLDYFTL